MRKSYFAFLLATTIAGFSSLEATAAPAFLTEGPRFQASQSASPQDSTSQSDSKDEEGPKPYAEVVTAEAESDDGLFTVHMIDEKYFFEIPESLLGIFWRYLAVRFPLSGSSWFSGNASPPSLTVHVVAFTVYSHRLFPLSLRVVPCRPHFYCPLCHLDRGVI